MLATVVGAVVKWVRISDRTVSRAVEKAARQSEKAAREAADGVRADVRAEVKALSEKLATNDFPPRGETDRPGVGGGPRRADASSAWRPGCGQRYQRRADTDDSEP